MKHLKSVNRKAARIEQATARDVVALQRGGVPQMPHFPLGCSLDCHTGCYWPAQVPDQLNHAPDWTAKCAAAQKDWRKMDLIFP